MIKLMNVHFVKLEHTFQTWIRQRSKYYGTFDTLPWFLAVSYALGLVHRSIPQQFLQFDTGVYSSVANIEIQVSSPLTLGWLQ
jgi:hypothetical protein